MPDNMIQNIDNVTITDITEEGKGRGRHDDKVVFVTGALPGDRVNVRVRKHKKKFIEADIQSFESKSPDRIDPRCKHLPLCGGCKWQDWDYPAQLRHKEKYAQEQLKRIGKITDVEYLPIKGANEIFAYRNKLEFSFTSNRWLFANELGDTPQDTKALGFHVPGRFDKIFGVEECHLMVPFHNRIRNKVYEIGIKMGLGFHNPKTKEGYLRNLILRNSRSGQWMLTLVVGQEDRKSAEDMLQQIRDCFPEISSMYYIINTKKNDSVTDLPCIHFSGAPYIEEKLGKLTFRISPNSFFQTNPSQAEILYELVESMLEQDESQVLYDLYSGTGSIGLYLAGGVKKIVGIEYVQQAVDDAYANAALNGIHHASFFAGDLKTLLSPSLFEQFGKPDVIVTDPPRSGMHPEVIHQIIESEAKILVYVSCNVATQARDIALLMTHYVPVLSGAVDMFPHTGHMENVVKLIRRN
jgi:23S rRNA (uracil1939-C5)-methyltransferase